MAENKEWITYRDGLLSENNLKNETALGGRRATTESECLGEDLTMLNGEEQHLIFEGNLAAVFKKLKDVTFETEENKTVPKDTADMTMKEKKEESKTEVKEVKETTQEAKAKEENANVVTGTCGEEAKYYDSQYWNKGQIYTLESIEAEYVN